MPLDRRRFLARSAAASLSPLLSTLPSRVAYALGDDDNSLAELSLAEAAHRIRARDLTSVQLTTALLHRIELLNPLLNAYITILREPALARASMLDDEAAHGHLRGPLHGIPLALKDNIDTAGVRTTAASAALDDRVPSVNAPVVSRLLDAGAVILGKTNLHEFAMGGSSATSYFGPVRNPWDLARTSGGSSGGSAAAVSASLATSALGTDTGGSIRIPASFCSVVGLKPTFGLVSNRGILPLIYSLDHTGTLTRTVADAAILLSTLAGYDPDDPVSVDHPREDYLAAMQAVPVRTLRLGIPRTPFFDHLDPAVAEATDQAITVLSSLVASTRTVTLPAVSSVPWTELRSGEVWSNHRQLFRSSGDLYSLQTHRVVADTQHALDDTSSETAADRVADLVDASRSLALLRHHIDAAFTDFDLVALPTMRILPRTIDDELDREENPQPREPEITANAIAFNLFGIPAISVPCGFSPSGLPIGLTIAGPHFSEARILALANAFQSNTAWHTRQPRLSPGMPLPPIHRRS